MALHIQNAYFLYLRDAGKYVGASCPRPLGAVGMGRPSFAVFWYTTASSGTASSGFLPKVTMLTRVAGIALHLFLQPLQTRGTIMWMFKNKT